MYVSFITDRSSVKHMSMIIA